MDVIGVVVITMVMACAAAGAIAAVRDDEKGLGKEFLEGLHAIGFIFVPVAGIMAAVPYLAQLIRVVLGPAFSAIGADPAMAATTFIAVDMGGYQLADKIATTRENWIMAMMTGYMAGATIVFSIPVGLALLEKRDHKYMALGVLSGILSVPVGILISSTLIFILAPFIRPVPSGDAVSSYQLALGWQAILLNLSPLVLFVLLIALGLHFIPDKMIRGFMIFGRVMDGAIKLVLVCAIIEYFTGIFYKDILGQRGLFSYIFGQYWYFDPIIADDRDKFRALEIAGYIGLMLCGAFPMVYLIKKYFAKPMEKIGKKLGLEAAGAAGILASTANILAMFRLIKDMRPKDKVLNIAFAVCAAFLFGDHLAFTTNFQPNLLLAVMFGKLGGGIFAFVLAYRLSVPKALELERQEMEEELRAVIALVPALRDRKVTIEPLSGGLTNRNYRVDADGESYVLRITDPESRLLGIDRDCEVACCHAASAAGVGASVIAYLPEQMALVTSFVPGKLLTDEDTQRPDVMRRLVQSLRRYHDYAVPTGLGVFSPFATVRSYHAMAQERKVPLPEDLGRALELLRRIGHELKTDEPPCLCHNDLLPGNFIDDGVTVRIIDWEYGGLGDRFFDLGNFAVNHQLSEEQERALLEFYFGGARPEHLRRLQLMRLASDMREAMWGYLQAGISKLYSPSYYLDYGRTHLDRFLGAASAEAIDVP